MWDKSYIQIRAEQLSNVLLWVQIISLKITFLYGRSELSFQNYVFKGKGIIWWKGPKELFLGAFD